VAAVLIFAKYARVGDRKRKRKENRGSKKGKMDRHMAKTRGREKEM
jgi:hypothetical protein